MAVKFEFYESPNTIGTRKKRYHARVVNRERISTDHLAQEIHHSSSLTVADIKATCPETPTPHSTRANNVKFKSVTFRADKYLKKQLADVKTERSKYKPHSIPVTDEEIDKGLTEYFLTHSVLTRRDFEQLFTLTRATAGRYITRLAKEKKLCNISIPHNPIYEPMPGFYGKEKLPEPEQETDTATE